MMWWERFKGYDVGRKPECPGKSHIMKHVGSDEYMQYNAPDTEQHNPLLYKMSLSDMYQHACRMLAFPSEFPRKYNL